MIRCMRIFILNNVAFTWLNVRNAYTLFAAEVIAGLSSARRKAGFLFGLGGGDAKSK